VIADADYTHFQINFEALSAAITHKTQGVIINSPNNPSGAIYTAETLARLGEMLTEKSREVGHPIYLISDEPYRELVYDGKEVPYVPAFYPYTIVCYSYSKSLSLPGDRIGYVLVPPTTPDCGKILSAVAGAARMSGHVCAPALLQRVVGACVDARPDLSGYDRCRTRLYEALTALGYRCVHPDGAFYLMVESPCGDGAAFSQRAKEEGLLVVPCGDFGCPAFVRIAYCVGADVVERALPIFAKLRG
jgi:aspartate aminotransferase